MYINSCSRTAPNPWSAVMARSQLLQCFWLLRLILASLLSFSTHISHGGGGGGGVPSGLYHQAIPSPIISGWTYSIKGPVTFLLIMINLKKLIHATISVATR